MKRFFLNVLFWGAIIAYYFISLGFVSDKRQDQVCTTLRINVVDSALSRFVTEDDILGMVENRTNRLVGIKFDSINISKIEQRLSEFAPIRRSVIYKTIDGAVNIDITQRTPVVRVINRYGESFYLDERGEMLKHSNNYYAHVLVANGYINLRPDDKGYNVLSAENIIPGRRNIMRELFDLANYINRDKFWKAQIQQIYVNEDGDFELIPLVGAHVIVFGTFENPEVKFSNLASFYRNGLIVKGWNTYDVINLKYDGQVVAKRR